MNRSEFKQWADDLGVRLPELGAYLLTLQDDTKTMWYSDIFANFELRDALTMNRRIMESGEGLGRFERDKLPGLFIRTLQQIAWERGERERTKRLDTSGARRRIVEDAIMGPMLAYVVDKIRGHKKANNGEMPTGEQIHEWTQQASADYDTEPDDEYNSPRYRCLRCRDSGMVSFNRGGVDYTGACSKCDKGKDVAGKQWKSGRMLGFDSVPDAEDNPFNRAGW